MHFESVDCLMHTSPMMKELKIISKKAATPLIQREHRKLSEKLRQLLENIKPLSLLVILKV